ncbi:TPA: hypothetical protein I7686_21275 [Vibrio vulnificus]|uniref:adenylyltransferase/cytidyltransferase family protein n=1 Tax=Vibrio vulnificus TaxID=672 RepID=UPI001A2836D4|nr:adenylyltransferase/cytidyltransferase family protein [Vibrio vulnificus]HAS8254985.1 hypothetical protein [Vibrio vulnificus]
MIIGYTSGVFDMFHIGHSNFLEECRKYCDILYVAVDSDNRVKVLKGKNRPMNNITTRLFNVNEHCDISFIKIFPSQYYLNLIKPDIIFESSIKIQSKKHFSHNLNIVKIPYTHGVSTTKLIQIASEVSN